MKKSISFNPPVIAHRGASAYAPENTMSAFVKAAQMGAKWVEFDVMKAACGEPIIFHDEYLDRTTSGRGKVNDYPYSYLASLDAGKWFNPIFSGERIPTLKSMLDFLQHVNVSANIEIKTLNNHEERFIKRIVDDTKQVFSLTNGKILFSSFSMDVLHVLRDYQPDCLIGYILDEDSMKLQPNYESLNLFSIHVDYSILTKEFAYQVKNSGKQLLCYTVNDTKKATELFSLGVDAVFTDTPDKLISIL